MYLGCNLHCGEQFFPDTKVKLPIQANGNWTQNACFLWLLFFLPLLKFSTWFYFNAKPIVCMIAHQQYTPPCILFCATPYHKSHFISLCQVPALRYKTCILVAHNWGGAVAW